MKDCSLISLPSRVTVPEGIIFRDLGGEAVIMELANGRYYGLDEVGTRMWIQLHEHGEIEAAYLALLEEYQVSAQQLRADLLGFINRLASRKLLKLVGE